MTRYMLSAKDAKTLAHRDVERVVLLSVYEYRQNWLDRLHGSKQISEVVVKDVFAFTTVGALKEKGKEWFPETKKITSGSPADSKADLITYGEDEDGYVLWSAEVWPI